MEKDKVLKLLNDALAQEHACQIRYRTHAALVTGPYSEAIESRLKEIAEDEKEHADMLRDRITSRGGVPTIDVAREDLIPASTFKQILEININEEKRAIALYRGILNLIESEEAILYQTIQRIIKDEQGHLEELERFVE